MDLPTTTIDSKKAFLPNEVTTLLQSAGRIPDTLVESYERLVFAILLQLDFQVLFGLQADHFLEHNGEVYLQSDEAGVGSVAMADHSNMVNLYDVGGDGLVDVYRRHASQQQAPFFGFIRPVIFSAHIKKILLTVGITREITIHPRLAVLSGQPLVQESAVVPSQVAPLSVAC